MEQLSVECAQGECDECNDFWCEHLCHDIPDIPGLELEFDYD